MVFKLHLSVVYGSHGKRLHLLYTLTDWLCLTEVDSVYCALRTQSLHIRQTSFVFNP